MRRQRLTWNSRSAEQSRRRRADSDLPTGEPASPLYEGQPAFDKYEEGDPSAWAEDVHPGPYENGEAPAVPTDVVEKAAALEKKAAKCIRIAQDILGKNASVAEIEDKALELMDLPERRINARVARIESSEDSSDERRLRRRLAYLERKLERLAGEEKQEEEQEEEMEEKQEEESKKKVLTLFSGPS